MQLRFSPIRSRYGLLALTVLAVSILASHAEAQGWLADRQRTEGPGLRVGDFEVHPGLGVELGYDSNLYYTSEDPAPGLPRRYESAILRVTPHLFISTLGPARQAEGEGRPVARTQPIAFRAGITASYYEFFADERRRNVSLGAGLNLTVAPSPIFSIVIADEFARSIRPFTENTFETSTARDQNTASIHLVFNTEGNMFQVRTGYRFGLDYFEGASFRYGSSMTHTVEMQETFRFLPQTGIVHDMSVAYRDYFEAGTRPSTAVFDSTTVMTRIGLNGAITPEISLLGMVGYAAGFFDSNIAGYDQDFESVVAQAQLSWQIAPNVRTHLGYQRSFQPSFVGNYSSQDRGFLGAQMMFGGQFLLGIEGGVAYVDFGQIVAPCTDRTSAACMGPTPIGSTLNREDIRVDASLFGEYRFTEWLGVNGAISYVGDFTDFRYSVAIGPMTSVLDPAGYHKVEMWLGVRVFY